MGNDDRRGSWGSYPDRARLPQGYGRAMQKSSRGRRPKAGAQQAYQQDHAGHVARGSQQSRSRVPRPDLDYTHNGPPPRAVALFVLVLAIVIVTIVGIAGTTGGGSAATDATVPISLLPFPQNTVTSTAQ